MDFRQLYQPRVRTSTQEEPQEEAYLLAHVLDLMCGSIMLQHALVFAGVGKLCSAVSCDEENNWGLNPKDNLAG